jgi:hypothetical protein
MVVSVIAIVLLFPRVRKMMTYFSQESQSNRGQQNVHARTFERVLRPAAEWVRSFHRDNERLPSQAELNDSASNHGWSNMILIYTNAAAGEASWTKPGTDFVLCVHISDWNLYYQSWDAKEFKYWTD